MVDHDPGADAASDISLGATGLRRRSRRLDVLAWDRFTRSALALADQVVVFTDRDRLAVERLVPAVPIERIPIAVDVPPVPLDPLGADPPVVLFFGNYLHAPNSDAALRLLGTIMPCVRAERPQARLELVGDGPTEEMTRMSGDGVHITGAVPSLEPHLDAAAVVVVPIRIGGGIRVKVLEALAAGKAVVASPRAIEGLGVTHEREVLVADTDEEICAATVALLADPTRRAELAQERAKLGGAQPRPRLGRRRLREALRGTALRARIGAYGADSHLGEASVTDSRARLARGRAESSTAGP